MMLLQKLSQMKKLVDNQCNDFNLGKLDYFYLPVDVKTKQSLGYAYLNTTKH